MPWVTWNGGFNFVGLQFDRVLEHLVVNVEKDINALRMAEVRLGLRHDTEPNELSSVYLELPEKFIRSTVVEAATPLLPAKEGGIDGATSDAFDRCLEELQLFMDAYSTVTGDITFRPIASQLCRPTVPMTSQDLEGNYGASGMFWAHEGVSTPYDPDDLDEARIEKLNIMWKTLSAGGPFDQFVRRARVAHREYQVNGDHTTSVIAAYTACEVLLNSLLLLMAWEDGTPRSATFHGLEEALVSFGEFHQSIRTVLAGTGELSVQTIR